jgi:Regulator of Chromosome Condensation (RCC1) repeat protein/regulator of chromosome condensation (RCC1) repeat-containing protein/Big-like domain-containing protein
MIATARIPTVLPALAAVILGCGSERGPTQPATPAKVTSVRVSPATRTFLSLGDSTALSAVATDSQGNVVNNVSFTWGSSDSSVAAVRASGEVIAVSNGSAVVAAAAASVTGDAVVTVAQRVASLELTPRAATLAPSDTIRLLAMPRDANGHAVTGRTITWSAMDTGVTTVDSAGLVTAVASRLGPTTIRASSGGGSDSAAVTVVVTFASIAAGAETCGLTSDSVAYCWGNNAYLRPLIVSRTLKFSAISVGQHACGIAASAGYCWGLNNLGQLGDGSTTSSASPVLITGGHAFSTLSAGYLHTCGLEGNSAYCWGNNTNGAIGDSTAFNRSSPTLVAGGQSFALISAGDDHTCAVSTGGSGSCWGYLQASPTSSFSQLSPRPIGGGLTFTTMSAGKSGANGHDGAGCGLVSTASTYCWGPIDDPQPITTSVTFTAVTVGGGHACGLTATGAAYCWGANTYGQLGDGSQASSIAPVAVSGGLVFAVLSAGEAHTCGVTSSGAAYCWGFGESGQLGDGNAFYSRPNPTRVLGSGP